ncbi:alpha/beta hydrolase [Actinoplanes sp. CA-142083]|uniref:alpha/beta hydrolase n=1 Tax=Actinoplanes sp. CA-142083 TaxID=3239903 RepID=UPI003D8CB9E2
MKKRLLALVLTLGVVAGAPSASAVGSSGAGHNPYEISWKPCPERPEAQCGTVRVPLDWGRPKGEKITLAVGRHLATDPAHRVGALFVNPGGPGGESAEIAENADLIFSPELVARFDIVGVDPRGIGGSNPISCRIPDPQPGYTLFPRTEAQFAQMVRYNRALGRGCLQNTGPLLGHVDTVSVARDHEAVRIGLGESKFNWLGLSYGTQVGANYAELFPGRVRAMAFDGALDHSATSVGLLADEIATVEDAFNRFAEWCRTTSACAMAGQDVARAYDQIVARADASPMPVPGADHPVTGDDIRLLTPPYLEFKEPTVFAPVSGWLRLGAAIRDTLAGDASAFALPPPQSPTEDVFGSLSVVCQDYALEVHSFADMQRRIQLGRYLAPHLQGGSQSWLINRCIGWPLPPSNPARTLNVRGVPPVLIVNATHDANTTYKWAYVVAGQIPGSVVFTRLGDGHTSYLVSPCARAVIDRYLIDRALPGPEQVCTD